MQFFSSRVPIPGTSFGETIYQISLQGLQCFELGFLKLHLLFNYFIDDFCVKNVIITQPKLGKQKV